MTGAATPAPPEAAVAWNFSNNGPGCLRVLDVVKDSLFALNWARFDSCSGEVIIGITPPPGDGRGRGKSLGGTA